MSVDPGAQGERSGRCGGQKNKRKKEKAPAVDTVCPFWVWILRQIRNNLKIIHNKTKENGRLIWWRSDKKRRVFRWGVKNIYLWVAFVATRVRTFSIFRLFCISIFFVFSSFLYFHLFVRLFYFIPPFFPNFQISDATSAVVMCATLTGRRAWMTHSHALSCRQAGGGAKEIQSKAHCSNSGIHSWYAPCASQASAQTPRPIYSHLVSHGLIR